jgi:hypothetical protein
MKVEMRGYNMKLTYNPLMFPKSREQAELKDKRDYAHHLKY